MCAETCKNKNSYSKNMQKYAKNMQKFQIHALTIICTNMHKYLFYMQKYMQKHVKIKTVLTKHAEICKKYAKIYIFICTNMQKYGQHKLQLSLRRSRSTSVVDSEFKFQSG